MLEVVVGGFVDRGADYVLTFCPSDRYTGIGVALEPEASLLIYALTMRMNQPCPPFLNGEFSTFSTSVLKRALTADAPFLNGEKHKKSGVYTAMPLAYGGAVSTIDLGSVKLYVWAAVRNGARYLYAQLYAGWRRRRTVYLGRDVNEIAGRIVSATAELGRTAGWYTAEKAARRLLHEFAVVRAVYNALREKARGRGHYAKAASLFGEVIEAVFDLRAVEDVLDVAEADPWEVERRLERLSWLAAELCG